MKSPSFLKLHTHSKLQLANYKWTSLTDPATAEANLDSLVSTMKAELDDLRQMADGGALSSPHADTSPAIDGGEVTSPSDVAVGLDLQQGSSSPGTVKINWCLSLLLRLSCLASMGLLGNTGGVLSRKKIKPRFLR